MTQDAWSREARKAAGAYKNSYWVPRLQSEIRREAFNQDQSEREPPTRSEIDSNKMRWNRWWLPWCRFLRADEAQQAGEPMGHPRRTKPSLAIGLSLKGGLWLKASSILDGNRQKWFSLVQKEPFRRALVFNNGRGFKQVFSSSTEWPIIQISHIHQKSKELPFDPFYNGVKGQGKT